MTIKKAYYGDCKERLLKRKIVITVVCVAILFGVVAIALGIVYLDKDSENSLDEYTKIEGMLANFILPNYFGNAYEVVNENILFLSDNEFPTSTFEIYSSLDSLGRCGPAYACLGLETMPL